MTEINWTYLIIAGVCKTLRDVSDHPSMQWLWRFRLMVRWRETHVKLFLWPLDMWHICELAMLLSFARSFMGWTPSVIVVTLLLAVFQTAWFSFNDRPVAALQDWWRKLRVPKEDHMIP